MSYTRLYGVADRKYVGKRVGSWIGQAAVYRLQTTVREHCREREAIPDVHAAARG